jgi:hypothetical protein
MTRFVLLILLSTCLSVLGQSGRVPANGANGVQGQYLRSFSLAWSRVPGAVKYEYLLTDNPNCFEGCAGDTRQKIARDTTSLEFDLEQDTYYYWILRFYYDETTSSEWQPIYSFLARYEQADAILRLYPNPVSDRILHANVDWSVNPEFATFQAEVVDCFGKTRFKSSTIAKTPGFKNDVFTLDISTLGSGLYTCAVVLTNAAGTKYERMLKRIVVP